MNLLKDDWIPVRPLQSGNPEKISLRRLLCGEEKWEVCLPRDDMELAAIQLMICLAQTLFMTQTVSELKQRIAKPLAEKDFEYGIKPPYCDWFQLDHPEYPFMQMRTVRATEITPMDKLLAGLNSSTNSCFVNEAGMGEVLCGGCAAVALFNQASCSPSFGGGFKASLRGSAPVTTLVQGPHLRQTVWLNVLCDDNVTKFMTWHRETCVQKPTWIDSIKAGEPIAVERIGLLRGLFWQPAYIELSPHDGKTSCSCCGFTDNRTYNGFKKAKFNFTISGAWPHPHTPRIMISKKGQHEEKFAAFTTIAPSWTQLSRFVVSQEINDSNTEGQQPAAVILQMKTLYGTNSEKLHLLIGGYRNNQASILERRHEVFTLNHGWDKHTDVIKQLVSLGRGYKDALYRALNVFVKGIKEIKGAGVKIHQVAEAQFYRRSELTILNVLARIDFEKPAAEMTKMGEELKQIAKELFEETTRPYLNDPELIHTSAVARRTLNKHLNNLEPQQDKGGNNGATTT